MNEGICKISMVTPRTPFPKISVIKPKKIFKDQLATQLNKTHMIDLKCFPWVTHLFSHSGWAKVYLTSHRKFPYTPLISKIIFSLRKRYRIHCNAYSSNLKSVAHFPQGFFSSVIFFVCTNIVNLS